MKSEEIEELRQTSELAISIFVSKKIAHFKERTGKEISSITIPMIDVTSMDPLPKTQYIPGQCLITLAEELKQDILPAKTCNCSLRTKLAGDGCEVCNPEYAKQFEEKDTWVCCGGVELQEDEKCPTCGDRFE